MSRTEKVQHAIEVGLATSGKILEVRCMCAFVSFVMQLVMPALDNVAMRWTSFRFGEYQTLGC